MLCAQSGTTPQHQGHVEIMYVNDSETAHSLGWETSLSKQSRFLAES